MYCLVESLGLEGIRPYLVRVEVDSRRALPGFDIVGMPDMAVKESRERVCSAARNMGYPPFNSKIVVNMAPADTKKTGAVYDLPIMLGFISACGWEELDIRDTAFVGEVGLSGEIRPIAGVLPMVLEARRLGLKQVVVPRDNAPEAAAGTDIRVLAASHVSQVIAHFKGQEKLPLAQEVPALFPLSPPQPDLCEVKGQQTARRALEVAAAGGHNLLLIGPPGTGKSMLAKRLPSILPALSREEAVETTKIHSVAGILPPGGSLIAQRPFRAPHHSVSAVSLIGGGPFPKPGEISLAHNGVLFLDELPEFQKIALEILRQPLEDGVVNLSRVKQRLSYPCRVMLVGAMNPCPCGYFGHPSRACTCPPGAIRRYLDRISGPLLDRLDLHIEVKPVNFQQLSDIAPGEGSEPVRQRVETARALQRERYAGTGISCNASLTTALLREACAMDTAATSLLGAAYDRLGLSARGYDRLLKVARTVADLEGAPVIGGSHISQAIQLRSLDRRYWGQ